MAIRIAGITIPSEKRVETALTYIYGIGYSRSANILKETSIKPDKRVKELNEEEVKKLRDFIEKNERVEGDLKREMIGNVKRLKEIRSYRGTRHMKNLPVRGQRTKTNNRTVRGNRRQTMASGRRQAAQKT